MYVIICTWPIVSCALRITSRYQAITCENLRITVKNIIKYLRRTKHTFLVYDGKEELTIKGYINVTSKLIETIQLCSRVSCS